MHPKLREFLRCPESRRTGGGRARRRLPAVDRGRCPRAAPKAAMTGSHFHASRSARSHAATARSRNGIQADRPKSAWMLRQTEPRVVAEIDRLLDHDTEAEIDDLLNRQGLRSGEGKSFHRLIVRRIRCAYALSSRYERVRARGMLSLQQIAKPFNVCLDTAKRWRRAGLLTGCFVSSCFTTLLCATAGVDGCCASTIRPLIARPTGFAATPRFGAR